MKNSFKQPYMDLRWDELIKLEKSLQRFSRISWNQKIDYGLLDENNGDIYVLDENNNRIIIFPELLKQSEYDLSILMQIMVHWVLGYTKKINETEWETESFFPAAHINKHEALEVFFRGLSEDVSKLRRQSTALSKQEPSLDWTILHFHKSFIEAYYQEEIKNINNKLEAKGINGYELYFVYGVVSQSNFRHSDKSAMIQSVEGFLAKQGFEQSKSYSSYNHFRNTPILLWKSKLVYKDSTFHTMLGIDFGFDNGLSSFRLAIGIIFEDESYLAPLPYKMFYSVGEEKVIETAFKSWIHHRNSAEIVDFLNRFLQEEYEKIFDLTKLIVDKMAKYETDTNYEFIATHTHSYEFQNKHNLIKEVLKHYIEKFKNTPYSQFRAWLNIAHSGEFEINQQSTAANIAESLLLDSAKKIR